MIGTNIVHASYKHGVKKLLNLGSSCIYPRLAPQPMKESCLLTSELEKTNEAYALAKISIIKLCRYYNQQYGTNFISAMPTNQYGIGDNFNMETFGNRVLVDSLDPAKDEAKMSLVMTENDMDNILINVLSQASTINRFVKKAYCTINGDKYDFFVDIDGVYIKSRLRISTTLKDDVENDRFVFQISDMAIGKFTGLRNIG